MKKRIVCCILAMSVLLALSACGTKEQSDDTVLNRESSMEQSKEDNVIEDSASNTNASGDVDLTALSSTMVYAEVYNMMADPESYKGRTVKMQGQFAVYEGEDRNYYACIISDATACCAQGIEFVLDGEYTYPNDYPEIGSIITVEGIFDWYDEALENGTARYCQLINASLK